MKVPKKGLFILKRNAVISEAFGAFLKHSGWAFVGHERREAVMVFLVEKKSTLDAIMSSGFGIHAYSNMSFLFRLQDV